MPIADLLQTQTFRDWFNKTNEIIDTLNASVLANGVVSNGSFTANGSLKVVNTFFANSSLVDLRGNTTITANAVVSSNCNTFNFACGLLLIQPINGTVVNSAALFTANAPATFAGLVAFGANVSITGDVQQLGNTLINGTLTSNNGPLVCRQVLFAASNAQVLPAHLNSAEYDDYGPPGLNEATLWNAIADIDTTITGIQAPTNFAVGARILYLQNIGTTYSITLVSANTNSGLNNRFKFPNDVPVIVAPGTAVPLIWSSTNKEWRTLSAPAITGNASFSGNVIVSGWLNVAQQLVASGNTSLGATLTVAGNTTLNGARCFANGQLRCDTTNGRFVLPVGTNLWAT